MKKFYTAADVNFYASKGESVIYINPGDVVTSVAREEAEKKGIRFAAGEAPAPARVQQPAAPYAAPVQAQTPSYQKPATVAVPAAPAPSYTYPQVKALPYKGLLSEDGGSIGGGRTSRFLRPWPILATAPRARSQNRCWRASRDIWITGAASAWTGIPGWKRSSLRRLNSPN